MNIKEWKSYKISDIFTDYTGTDLILRDIDSTCTDFNIISHKKHNNSVGLSTEIIEGRKLFDCNCTIAIADRGFFKASVQTKNFYIGTRVKALEAKFQNCNKYILMFLSIIINQEEFRFSYGRNCCDDLPNIIIKLPSRKNDSSGYEPDYEYMENFIKNIYRKIYFNSINKKTCMDKIKEISLIDWKSFKLIDIWENIKRGERQKSEDREPGDIPYYSASEFNNGRTDTIANPTFTTNDALIYTTFGDCFYVEGIFTASDEITIFKHSRLNKYNALFIATVLNQSKYKYQFGRKAFYNKFENEKIKLPAIKNKSGEFEPDWQYMENYIKSLPYSSNI